MYSLGCSVTSSEIIWNVVEINFVLRSVLGIVIDKKLVPKHRLAMKQFIIIFTIFSILVISCKKEYTQQEKNRIDALTTKHVYKLNVPDDAFVFCLDTIKADEEYQRLSEEFCKRGRDVESYLYLSSYDVYIPIQPQYMCDDYIWNCWRNRSYLAFIVNNKRQWLIEDEIVEKLSQSKMNSLLTDYYRQLKLDNKTYSALIHFKVNSIKVNEERDSLYISLLDSYYTFIKKEKVRANFSLDSLRRMYPFNLAIGQYILLPPPPSINQEVIEINEEIKETIF